jgi:anti-sigma regulatory factor (Ser/Thr protein kinase)
MVAPTDEAHGQHRALLYGDADEFVDAVAPFVRDGLRQGERILLALSPEKEGWVREALGDAADVIERKDASAMYTRNGPMLTGLLQRFVTNGHSGEAPLRVVAEPALSERNPVETRAYSRYEAAANVAYRPFAVTVLCPYDTSRLPDAVLQRALETHPHVLDHAAPRESATFTDPREFIRRHSLVEPPPPDATEIVLERLEDVTSARHRIARLGAAAGLSRSGIDEVSVAVTELATNALVHGLAPRRIWSYSRDGSFVCHVHDAGQGLADPLAGYLVPDITGTSGRGLWIAHQLCDVVEATVDATGSHVCLRMTL